MQCTRKLSEDHRVIHRAVEVLKEMAARAERERDIRPDDVKDLLEFFRCFADDLHQMKEESVLFPVLLKTTERKQTGPVHAMVFEHDQERSLVEGLEDALYTTNLPDFVYYAKRMAEILTNHMHKEEHLLFELVEKTLTDEEDRSVSEGFRKCDEEKEIVLQNHFARLRELEWRYLGKAAHIGEG